MRQQPGDECDERWRRRFFQRPENRSAALRVLQAIDVAFCRLYHRLELISPCLVPRDGPGIIVANHVSALDPPMLQSVVPRLVRFMADENFYRAPVTGWLMRRLEVIRVPRGGGGGEALRAGLRVLERGELLGLFPEGRIEYDRALLPFQSGAALLALRSGAPVFPVYVDGTQRNSPAVLDAFLRPHRAVIAFGAPLRFGRGPLDRAALAAATGAVRASVQHLMDEVIARRPVAVRLSRPHGRADLFRRGSIERSRRRRGV